MFHLRQDSDRTRTGVFLLGVYKVLLIYSSRSRRVPLFYKRPHTDATSVDSGFEGSLKTSYLFSNSFLSIVGRFTF